MKKVIILCGDATIGNALMEVIMRMRRYDIDVTTVANLAEIPRDQSNENVVVHTSDLDLAAFNAVEIHEHNREIADDLIKHMRQTIRRPIINEIDTRPRSHVEPRFKFQNVRKLRK